MQISTKTIFKFPASYAGTALNLNSIWTKAEKPMQSEKLWGGIVVTPIPQHTSGV